MSSRRNKDKHDCKERHRHEVCCKRGPTGPAGARGPVGPKGDLGSKGPMGPAGATGPTGLEGPRGDPGCRGVPGCQGDRGCQGEHGDKGKLGDTGPAGRDGATGATGPTGPTAAPGATGPTGPAGPNPELGPTGPTGPTGTVETFVINTRVTTGAGEVGELLQYAMPLGWTVYVTWQIVAVRNDGLDIDASAAFHEACAFRANGLQVGPFPLDLLPLNIPAPLTNNLSNLYLGGGTAGWVVPFCGPTPLGFNVYAGGPVPITWTCRFTFAQVAVPVPP